MRRGGAAGVVMPGLERNRSPVPLSMAQSHTHVPTLTVSQQQNLAPVIRFAKAQRLNRVHNSLGRAVQFAV
jgi:hypothetical protein